jgi:adenosine deaminase
MKDGPKSAMNENFTKFIQEAQKTEIHLHLEGLVSVDSLWSLKEKHNLALPGISDKKDLEKRFNISSLTEFIDLFINVIQTCFREPDDLDYLFKDAEVYLKRNNIRYAEIFFAPTKFLMNGISYPVLLQKLEFGAKQIESNTGIVIRYLIDVSRSFGVVNAKRNLKHVLQNPSEYIIGIGLGGSEMKGPARKFRKIFQKASKEGLKVVAHAGEDVGPESIWDAVRLLQAQRIGHGTSAILDPKLVKVLSEKKLPLEICPTSNLFTRKYATTLENHPIKSFYDAGLTITVNTDDPTIFGVDLNKEYQLLFEHGVFKPVELKEILKNTVKSSFAPTRMKESILENIESSYQKYH